MAKDSADGADSLTTREIHMNLLPPIPPWDQVHPIIVHFPIALLLTVPLAVLGAIVFKGWTRHLLVVAAGLVVIGTGFAALATASGNAAEEFTKGVAGAESVLDRHEDLAELSRNAFIGLSVALTVLAALVWRLGDRLPRRVALVGMTLYLAAHLVGAGILVNAAHEGGVLVHQLGVKAWSGNPAVAPAPTQHSNHDAD